VDKRCYTPSPAKDWRAGRVQKENSKGEEAYIQAILEICEKEHIETIFPSFDPHVYVFSKNKDRFQKRGILIPVPDYETVITPLDKYRTIKAAEAAGFPCPRTYLLESEDQVQRIALQLGFPLVIKPRFTAGGRGTAVVRDMSELLDKIRPIIETQGMPLMQEYIPGNQQENIHIVVDRDGEAKFLYQKKFHRLFYHRTFTLYRESIPPTPYGLLCGRFLQNLGWWGAGLVELKFDQRDHTPKLMEVNPRFGSGILDSVAVGMNAPWICLRVACAEKVETSKDYPAAIYLHPVEDSLVFGLQFLNLLICQFCYVIRSKVPIVSVNSPTSLNELIKPYRYAYFSRNKKVLDPITNLLFQDPVVSIILWLQHFASVLGAALDLGKSLFPEILATRRSESYRVGARNNFLVCTPKNILLLLVKQSTGCAKRRSTLKMSSGTLVRKGRGR
jgi:predicted ATP-grasp superfamily ATP-dependent carboligase